MTRTGTRNDSGADLSPADMDRIFDAHLAAESAQDLDALLDTLASDAVHEVVGDPAGALIGHAAIAHRYEQLFNDLQATGTVPLRRRHGPGFLVDECIYEAIATGQPFGVHGGHRPVRMRLLHFLEFGPSAISREIVWTDTAAVLAQLSEQPGSDRTTPST